MILVWIKALLSWILVGFAPLRDDDIVSFHLYCVRCLMMIGAFLTAILFRLRR